VGSAVCGKANGKRCPFFEGCGYLTQFDRARDADVLIVAHEFMFERLPKSVLHDVAYVIIEEDFIPTGDAITELSVDVFRSHSIGAAPALDRHGEADEEKTADLLRYSTMIATMADGGPDGYLADDALDCHHVTQSDARYLRYLHWNRQRDAQMHPGMSLAERREAQLHAAINQQLPRIAAMMLMLENGEAARIRLTTDNKVRRSIILHGRRPVAGWLSDKPTLMLNATARLADVQGFFPTAIMMDLPQARMPHQRVHPILGSFGKSAMTDSKVADLVAEARAHAAHGKAVLVICHEQCEAAFKAIPDVRTLHNGNYAGDDDHGDVDVILDIGGPFAPYKQIAEIAPARTGQAVPIVQPVRRPCVALMEDSTGVQFERMAYEHPAAHGPPRTWAEVVCRFVPAPIAGGALLIPAPARPPKPLDPPATIVEPAPVTSPWPIGSLKYTGPLGFLGDIGPIGSLTPVNHYDEVETVAKAVPEPSSALVLLGGLGGLLLIRTRQMRSGRTLLPGARHRGPQAVPEAHL
jgi:hypothetical protein